MNTSNFKHIKPQRLQFPKHLKFTTADNGLLRCNGKLVQVIPSLPIKKEDNPPADFSIYAIGKYIFDLSDAEVFIFSFVNSQSHRTDCAVINREELVSKLNHYHYEGDHANLKLILTEKTQLMECYNYGAEGFFMALWIDEKRDFSTYYNNWSVFDD